MYLSFICNSKKLKFLSIFEAKNFIGFLRDFKRSNCGSLIIFEPNSGFLFESVLNINEYNSISKYFCKSAKNSL